MCELRFHLGQMGNTFMADIGAACTEGASCVGSIENLKHAPDGLEIVFGISPNINFHPSSDQFLELVSPNQGTTVI
jgi:hypothetical protein